ncbi:unnamed protein product [Ectocarpus sp. 12 AP-2014]
MLAGHHSCTIPGGLPAATSNFAGLCLLHHAAWDRVRYQSLEDLGGKGQRRAAADAVDVLVSARGFVQPKKGSAAFGGEKEAFPAGAEKNDEVFEQAFDVIRTRLGPVSFTTQQRSDGGEEQNKLSSCCCFVAVVVGGCFVAVAIIVSSWCECVVFLSVFFDCMNSCLSRQGLLSRQRRQPVPPPHPTHAAPPAVFDRQRLLA